MDPRRRSPGLVTMFVAILAVLATMLAVPPAATAAPEPAPDKIDSALRDVLKEKGSADLWVRFDARADLRAAASTDGWVQRGTAVVDALQATAKTSQAQARALLDDSRVDYTPFYVSNRIYVRDATESMAAKLAALPGVTELTAPQTYEIPDPKPASPQKSITAVEWGVAAINADDVWATYGVRGEGIVVANIDTGAQFDHPALVGSYRGNTGAGTFDHNYNWFDPSNICGNPSAAPCDNNGHGTHTMGTMVGDDGAGNQIGVAPGAQWLAAKGCESSSCSDFALISSGQWMLAPTDLSGQNPRPDLRPHIVNNSWGAANGGIEDPFYDEIVNAWNAAGIFGVFSNGNSGPGCDTTGSPADSLHAYGVGAFDSAGRIASFSSRGPGAEGDIRPNISAPGVSVRSSVPGNGYSSFSGTSMAAPHLSGAVALMWSAAPALVDDVMQTRSILDDTAVDVEDLQCGGTADDNNVWGEGKVDALAAVAAAPRGPTGTLTGTVTDAASGAPLSGARVAVTGPIDRMTTTERDGTYSLLLSTGEYDLTVTTFGYATGSAHVNVTEDATTVQDFALAPAPAHPVTGHVVDDSGNAVANATVTILSTPIPPATTDDSGAFSFESVPEGSYEVEVTAGTCLAPQRQSLVVDGPETLDFSMDRRTDQFGYFCTIETPSWVPGDTLLPLTGDDQAVEFDLPFAATLYGETYDRAWVSTNGHLNFLARNTTFTNTQIPNPAAPNAAIYPFWDDLVLDSSSAVYTATLGEAPNRTVVLEYRNVRPFGTTLRLDFEVLLGESGDVLFQYRNLDPGQPRELGNSATVGIENATGTDAFQYSFNEAVLSDALAIRFDLPPNGFVQGSVNDRNDGEPVAGAAVRVMDGDTVVRAGSTAADGSYRLQVFLGTYTLEVSATNYVPASEALVIDEDGEVVTQDFALATARAEVSPGSVEIVLPPGFTRSTQVTLSNTGSADLTWQTLEIDRGTQGPAMVPAADPAGLDTEARDNRAAYTDEQIAAARPQAPGDVISSWTADGLTTPWGAGYTGHLWISDATAVNNTEFTTTGAPTGKVFDPAWAGVWAGDMAYDPVRQAVCQVNVGGDNAIHCWSPVDGHEMYVVDGPDWTGVSQRGVAYDETTDTFYVGGWNEDTLYHVAGSTHDNPGALLNECTWSDANIAGLAYNSTAGVVWASTNTATDTIYQLDPATCDVISSFGLPGSGGFDGAGLSLDATGNLWAVNQANDTVYLIDSGVPAASDVPWLSVEPGEGTLAPGGSQAITVTVDTNGLAPGVHLATVLLQTNSGRQPVVQVPVKLIVPAYRVGVNAAGGDYTDSVGDPWADDQPYTAGGYGYLDAGRAFTARGDVAGTEDDPLYLSYREGSSGYRFDDLPAGTYQVELLFAEPRGSARPEVRVFDVSVNGEFVITGHDIAAEVGGLTADRHELLVTVTEDGSVEIGLHARRGYTAPIINAIRVTHRPDM